MTNIFKWLLSLRVLIIVLIVLVIIDLIFRFSVVYRLPFDLNQTQIFNNVASPVISFLGFIGVIFTIWEMRKQNIDAKSLDYYNFYKERESQFFNSINEEIKPDGLYYSSQLLTANKLVTDMLSDFDQLQKQISSLDAESMGVSGLKERRDFIKTFILSSYVSRIINIVPEIIKHIFEIESNKLLKPHYKIALIEYIISNYLIGYIKICDSAILNDLISRQGGNLKNKYYELYDLLLRVKRFKKIVGNCSPRARYVKNH
jgi:hypothetical protein